MLGKQRRQSELAFETPRTRANPSKGWVKWIALTLPVGVVLGVIWFPLVGPVWAAVVYWMGTERFEGRGALARGGVAGVLTVFSALMGMVFLFYPLLLHVGNFCFFNLNLIERFFFSSRHWSVNRNR